MGASSSKAAQGAARKFPTRAPGAVPPTSTSTSATRAAPVPTPPQSQSPQARPKAKAATSKTDDILADSINPDNVTEEFSSRLRQMGVVQPNPTFSPTSTAQQFPHAAATQSPGPLYPSISRNQTLGTLEARRKMQQRATEEFEGLGRSTSEGREFLDLNTIVQVLLMREKGHTAADIEQRFDLKKGVIERLGRQGITRVA
ncbi:hypothetical protein C8034_v010157 [Colletotrichum sidae]|uniref:Helix-turn-helix domain-containing protein n=2 Tax=Colletotrichum orbiculare species complex TaxID=2707354 RepID=N4VZ64_COLOR|nr:hypothetical protein Cob_v009124 [Colletotrichum orbiculare MAFF 240422]TEA18593.1 hypothetical protein C8034_v010157 [Colletotrichum sidae]